VKRIVLHPGELHISGDPSVTVSTLLGSCVSACLYDPVHRIFGMNHFLLAARSYTRDALSFESQSGRYGLYAMELLINDMLHAGAERDRLRAKVFGGANVLTHLAGGAFAIGDVNSKFILSYLENEKIPIVASDLGGHQGRQIHFQGRDFSVFVRTLGEEKEQTIIANEKRYLEQAVKQQEHSRDESKVTYL
jgi:chemotaxis protein CheD